MNMKFRSVGALLTTAIASVVAGSAGMQAAVAASRTGVEHLALKAPITVDKVAPSLKAATGTVEVVVQLAGKPLTLANGANAKRLGGTLSPAQQSAHSASLRASQSATMTRIAALGGTELARVRIAYNALIVKIDASKIGAIATMSEVMSVRPVGKYQLDLSQTVPYVGASASQGVGFDGTGVRIAVLDSGIDFMHKNLGGPGTTAAYNTCAAERTTAPSGICADFFGPGAPKVIGGYDFVGEAWPNAGRAEDPNPIDAGTGAGHGTHVADIAGGRSADGSHVGVAPGAKLYAVKVCSSVSSSCNGVALLLGMDFALDPNGDGSMKDSVDVVNMSLGSSYGQIEDDLSAASANAVKAGVVVVVSAGNSADRPYITGSPAATPEVISVAQTSMPNAVAISLVVNTPANIAGVYANTNTLDWAPIGAGFTGNVTTATAVGATNNLACAPLAPAVFAGKVALIDRGSCNISDKVHNAATAGAIGILLANNAAGDAPSFSFGGTSPFTPAPTLVVTQAIGNLLKANLAGLNVTVSPSVGVPLAGSMASTSSRGPSYSFTHIKPEIGAPGASVSAEYGTGDVSTAFGGTSGAAPVVTGSAAILLQAFPKRTPAEIKAALMNSADAQIYTNPATQPCVLAPITRIGAGEVRALTNRCPRPRPPGRLEQGRFFRRPSRHERRLRCNAGLRGSAMAGRAALQWPRPRFRASVAAGGDASFEVCLAIDAGKLRPGASKGDSGGGNGSALQARVRRLVRSRTMRTRYTCRGMSCRTSLRGRCRQAGGSVRARAHGLLAQEHGAQRRG